jgi:aminopeptidase S
VYYSPATTEEFTQTEMEPVASDLYEYTIPGGRVTGNLKYFIAAADSLGNQQETGVYTVPVADFSIFPSSPTITVYRNGSSASSLNLVYANGFNEPLTFSASGIPQGLTVTFSPNPIPGGASKTALRVSADSTPPDGAFSILLTASFSPSESAPVAREAALGVLVADFGMQVAPISRTINVAGTATYAITMAISQGFVDPVEVTVQGLPQGASYELITSGTSAVLGGTGTMTLTLRVITTSSVKPGSYALTIVAVGGGLSHHVTVQLIVR